MESGIIWDAVLDPLLQSHISSPFSLRTEGTISFNGGGDLDGIPQITTDDALIYAARGFTFNNVPTLPVNRDNNGNPILQNGRQVLVNNAVTVSQGFTTTNVSNNPYSNLLPPQVIPAQTVDIPTFAEIRDTELAARTPAGATTVTFNTSQNPLNNANDWNTRFPAPGTPTNPRVVRVTGGGLNVPNNVNLSNYIITVDNGDINFNGSRHNLNQVVLIANNGNINLSSVQGTNVSILASRSINMNNQARFGGNSLVANGSGDINFDGATSTTNPTDQVTVISQGNLTFNNSNRPTRGTFLSRGNFTGNGQTDITGYIGARQGIIFNGQGTVTRAVIADTTPPVITAQLANDTGLSNTDRITNDSSITGTVNDVSAIVELKVGFGSTATFDILTNFTNGSFSLSRERINQIAGGTLADGQRTLKLLAKDNAGNVQNLDFAFTLDTTAPTLTGGLDAASDTPPVGDNQTTLATVTLSGTTEVNARVTLGTLSTTANASGQFSFANVSLNQGANAFTIAATDIAGNTTTLNRTITRLAGDTTAPVITAALLQDTGASSTDRITNNPAITGTVTDARAIITFEAALVRGTGTPTFVNVLPRLSGGNFSFDRAQLEALLGSSLIDGDYTLSLRAIDSVNNTSPVTTLSFTLDTGNPPLSLELEATSDTPPVGDGATTLSVVNLIGTTEASARVTLGTLSTIANGTGQFSFTDVPLNLGANAFVVEGTDVAGNKAMLSSTVTRIQEAPPITIGFTATSGTLALTGNSTSNIFRPSFSSQGFLELDIDGRHYSANPQSPFYDLRFGGASQNNVQKIDIIGGEGADTLVLENQQLSSLQITFDDVVEIIGTVSSSGDLAINASTINVKDARILVEDIKLQASEELEINNTTIVGKNASFFSDAVSLIRSTIDASSNTGGGDILIGGGFQGEGGFPLASMTFIDENSVIKADALLEGNGGNVAIWSEDFTNFLGTISAKGGSTSGDGGNVEVSGRESLAFIGDVNVDATAGNDGLLTIDPKNIVIYGGEDTVQGTTTFLNYGTIEDYTNLSLFATDSITVSETLIFSEKSGLITFNVTGGNITASDIFTNGRSAIFKAQNVLLDGIYTNRFLGDGSGSVSLFAEEDVSVSSINTISDNPGDISIITQGAINVNDISASATNDGDGADISLLAKEDSFVAFVFSSSSHGSAGNIDINTDGEFKSYQIFANTAGGNGGNISITSKSNILTSGIFSSSYIGEAGDIEINAAGRFETDINPSYLSGVLANSNTSADPTNIFGYAGAMEGSAGNITIHAGEIIGSLFDTRGDVAGGNISLISEGNIQSTGIFTESVSGNGGNISLISEGNIQSAGISTGSTSGNGGNISLISEGNIQSAGISTGSTSGESGNIEINAVGVFENTGDILANSSGNGGTITIEAAEVIAGVVQSASSGNGNGKDITITSEGNIFTSSVATHSNGLGKGGNIVLTSTSGSISTNNISPFVSMGDIFVGADQGDAGTITVNAKGDITTNRVTSSTNGGLAGDVIFNSSAGKIITGMIETSNRSATGSAGNLTIEAIGDVETGAIEAFATGTGNGGSISVLSEQGDIETGYLRSDSQGGLGGKIILDSYGTFLVNSTTDIDGIDFSIFTNSTGAESITLIQDINEDIIIGGSATNGVIGAIGSDNLAFVPDEGLEFIFLKDSPQDISTVSEISLVAKRPNTYGPPSPAEIIKGHINTALTLDVILQQSLVSPILNPRIAKDIQVASELAYVAATQDPKLLSRSYSDARAYTVAIFNILQSCRKYEVTDIAQIAYILGTASVESLLGVDTTENSNFPENSPAEINFFNNEYKLINGNGDISSGDGFRYRGKGLVQLTGKAIYQRFGQFLGVDIVATDNLRIVNNTDTFTDESDTNKLISNLRLSADAAVFGMKNDLFLRETPDSRTGLNNYINSSSGQLDFYNARSIVQGRGFTAISANEVAESTRIYFNLLKRIKYA